MTAKKRELTNYWRDDRLDYENVVLSNLNMQTSYMENVARSNVEILEDSQDTEAFHYWAAFTDIMQTFNAGCCTGHTIPKNLERARMAGMIDAFNTIIKGINMGEYME
jgi:hypothetical protein